MAKRPARPSPSKAAKATGGKARKAKAPPPPPPAPPAEAPSPPHTAAHLKRAFLAAFGEVFNVRGACALAGVGRRTFYDWLDADPAFRADYEATKARAMAVLEDEALRRAFQGVERLKFFKGQPILVPDPAGGAEPVPYVEREYSDNLVMFLLKAHDPGKYSERHQHDHQHRGEIKMYACQDQVDAV